MKKDVFGKGEAVLIDRIIEKLPMDGKNIMRSKTDAIESMTLTNKEYFYILRKIFHTFMFDMKEFAMDVYGLSVEEYLSTLTWLTYVDSIIYRMDLSIEKQASRRTPAVEIDFEAERKEIILFLQEHDLLDTELEKCVDKVIRYLMLEQEQLRQNSRLTSAEIFGILEFKSADLEVLRRIISKVGKFIVLPQEMEFFKLLDKIREIFDDIRDYAEDSTLKNFNTIIYLNEECKSSKKAVEILLKYFDQESARCRALVDHIEKKKQKNFLAICARLKEEIKYYLQRLHQLPDFKMVSIK